MGVTGLWKLIEPCGKPVPVDTLEGKILAVDISIWLHQAVKGFQDNKGSALENAHLLGLFHRLCKLLFYRVRPIFVFDGSVPQLKLETIARRKHLRSKLNVEATRIEALLLQSLAKEQIVQKALGANAVELMLKSPIKRLSKAARIERNMDEMFKLPELPAPPDDEEYDNNDSSFMDYKNGSASASITEDSSCDERENPCSAYNANLQAIDVKSEHFRSLPADIRHEILVDIKETRKQSSWGRLHELPPRSDDFSEFQMKRLLKRRAVQESLDEAGLEMGGRTLTYAELKDIFTEEGIIKESEFEKSSKQISSDENTRFVMVRDLTKKLVKLNENAASATTITEKIVPESNIKLDDERPSTSKEAKKLQNIDKIDEEKQELDAKTNADLQLAIALSLEDSNIYSENDYKYDAAESLKLNAEQRNHLRNAAVGPARAYMIEYAGLNEDEVVGIMDKTQTLTEEEAEQQLIKKLGLNEIKEIEKVSETSKVVDDDFHLHYSASDSDAETNKSNHSAMNLHVTTDGETDTDLEEVNDDSDILMEKPIKLIEKPLQIELNLSETINTTEDIFADIFEKQETRNDLEKMEKHKIVEETTKKVSEKITDEEKMKNKLKSCDFLDKPTHNKKVEKENFKSILDEIKKQVNTVKQINLDDIKIVIDHEQKKLADGAIEILDSDDSQNGLTMPKKFPKLKADYNKLNNGDCVSAVTGAENTKNENVILISDEPKIPEIVPKTTKFGNISIPDELDNKIKLNDTKLLVDVKQTNDTGKENKSIEILDSDDDSQHGLITPKKFSEVKTDNNKLENGNCIKKISFESETKNVKKILDELKKQVASVKEINLDDIDLEKHGEQSNVLLSSPKNIKQNGETIEIFDSDDSQKLLTTPKKSPKLTTPSKVKAITEYFQTEYAIKRTPDKEKEDSEVVPKVKSPFFRKRTAKYAENSSPTATEETCSPEKMSKAAKILFGSNNIEEIDDGLTPIQKIQTNPEDLIKEMANSLKEQKTETELQAIAADLHKEQQELELERNRQDRMGMSVNKKMSLECQELLRLFGIPYIVAPMEAEAQCAFLDAVELTNGTITDDSDIWLFGGRTVYKNFFAQNKHVLEFKAEQIEKCFNCDRKKLIQLACLVGSDYTMGVNGIGTVTALEILASFSKMNPTDENIGMRNSFSSVLSTLRNFRDWWYMYKASAHPCGSSAQIAISKKLQNIVLHEGFPNEAVIEAYLDPKVDESKEAFSWGYPDEESIREFARKNFGWTISKTNEILKPVMKKINEKKSQATIRNYFNVKSTVSLRELKLSKRVQNAIKKMGGEQAEEPSDVEDNKPKRSRAKRTKKPIVESKEQNADKTATEPKTRKVAKVKTKAAKTDNQALPCNIPALNVEVANTNDRNQTSNRGRKRKINLPNTKEVIPQREKDLEQMKKNKELAAEILKHKRNPIGNKKKKT